MRIATNSPSRMFMTNFFVFTHFYFIMYKLCINARSNEDLQAHSLQALENTRKTGKNYTIFTPKRYKRYYKTWKLRNLCTIYAENTQDNHDILHKNSYTRLFPLLRRYVPLVRIQSGAPIKTQADKYGLRFIFRFLFIDFLTCIC